MKTRMQLIAGSIIFLLTLTFAHSDIFAFQDEKQDDKKEKTDKQKKEETIVGTVVEAGVNEKGEVTAIAIEVEQETPKGKDSGKDSDMKQKAVAEYLIGDTEKRKPLMELIGQQIKATGVIELHEDGNTILVSNYKVVEPDKKSGTARK